MKQNTSVQTRTGTPDDRAAAGEAPDPLAVLFARRLRYRRPGPKSYEQLRTARAGRRPPRIAVLPASLEQASPPRLLDGDDPWFPDKDGDHPFGFSTVLFDHHGRPLPEDKASMYRGLAENEKHRRIARTQLFHRGAPVIVSTVFLGVDMGMSWDAPQPPTLWETMIFHGRPGEGGRPADFGWRYMSANAARVGHGFLVLLLRAGWHHGQYALARRGSR